MGACPDRETLRRQYVWLACLAVHLFVTIPEARGFGPLVDNLAGNTSAEEWVWSPQRVYGLLGGSDAWGAWSSRRLAIVCYPEDCYAVEGDEMYICAQQDFCAVYREAKERESSFWTEMDRDTEMATEKLALHWGARIAGFVGAAVATGAVLGILVSICASLGAAQGRRCCQRVQMMRWTTYRPAKVGLAALVLLVLTADAVGAYLLVRSGAEMGEDVNAGLLSSGIPQLLQGFVGSLPALNNPTSQHSWPLMLDNPTKWDIVMEKLSGRTWLQDMPTAKILMLNAPETLASQSSAMVNMSAEVYLGTALVAVAKTAATLLGEGTLYVGIDLWVRGKFNQVDFGFGCDFRLPLDTRVEGFPDLVDLIKYGIEDAVLYTALESGLQLSHQRGEVIMQVDSLKFEGEFVRRAILFGMLICGTIVLAAWCGSFVCCSALLRDREPRASVAEEAAERVERLKQAALQEKREAAARAAPEQQHVQLACNMAAPQQYGAILVPDPQPVYQYQAAQATYMPADLMQVQIQVEGDMHATRRDKE